MKLILVYLSSIAICNAAKLPGRGGVLVTIEREYDDGTSNSVLKSEFDDSIGVRAEESRLRTRGSDPSPGKHRLSFTPSVPRGRQQSTTVAPATESTATPTARAFGLASRPSVSPFIKGRANKLPSFKATAAAQAPSTAPVLAEPKVTTVVSATRQEVPAEREVSATTAKSRARGQGSRGSVRAQQPKNAESDDGIAAAIKEAEEQMAVIERDFSKTKSSRS